MTSAELIQELQDNIFTARAELIEQVIDHIGKLEADNARFRAKLEALQASNVREGCRFQGQDFDV